MYFEGEVAFSVVDSNDIDENISKIIGFEPTKIIKKGAVITKTRYAPFNIWSYEIAFNDLNFNSILSSFTQHLLLFKDNIKNIIFEHERVEINFYVRTNYGQFGFSIPNNELNKLSELGMDINFHLLSYGEVKD